jgi:hypothetical protein
MSEPQLDTASFLRRFHESKARVVLIGGMAAIAQGVPYLTQDIDFCYEASPENRARLIQALGPLRPRLRVAGVPDDLARELGWRWDDRTLRDAPNLTLQTDAGPIDLLSQVAGLGGYTEVLGEAVMLWIDGQEIAVLALPGLITAKRAAGRAKDMAVLPLLESTLLMREQRRQEQGDGGEEGMV